jgi:hypothetical protein
VDFANFLNGGTGKVTMDVKQEQKQNQKQRAVIEFVL